jgi:hypothetical protein
MVLGTGITEKTFKKYLRMIDSYEYNFKPFEYKPSFYCTDSFSKWWNDYYSRYSIGNAEQMLGMIESGFIVPTLGKKITVSVRGKESYPTRFIYFVYDITLHTFCTN